MSFDAVECFWVEPNGKAMRTLRRYRRGEENNCPASEREYHNATVDLGDHYEVLWASGDDGARYIAAIDVADYADDPRWPLYCECGYEFRDEDHWQVNQEPVYESEDGRKAWTSPAHRRKPTPGAMFDTFWRPELRKADGLAISVVCPDGQVWCVDDEATSGGFWTRTGTPPKITAQPSIQTGSYHGFLTNGVLTASLD